MKRQTEPTLMYMFRYFCGVAVVYFAILWIYAIISTGWLWKTQIQFWSSFTFYGLLLCYLSWRWLERRLRRHSTCPSVSPLAYAAAMYGCRSTSSRPARVSRAIGPAAA